MRVGLVRWAGGWHHIEEGLEFIRTRHPGSYDLRRSPIGNGSMSSVSADTGFPTVAGQLRAQAVAELARAIDCLGWRGARLHSGVHQARKSLRRVRATLRLGGTVLGPGFRVLDRELQRVIRSLSPLRDAQALVETLDRLILKSVSDDELRLLRRARRFAAVARAGTARTTLAGDPSLKRCRELLQALAVALHELAWESISLDQVREAVAHSSKAAWKAARRAQASGRDDDWHRWRRRARRFSQQERVLVNLGDHTAFKRSGKALAVLLGEAQDYSLLRAHCAGNVFPEADRVVLCKLAKKGTTRLRRQIAGVSLKGD